VHGITQFVDLTHEEFRSRYLNLDVSKSGGSKAQKVEIANLKDSANADWTGVYTTPVKDQGYCGSCWAFSATEQLESDSMRLLGTNYILSPQQVVSCDPQSFGCSGGWPHWAFDYIASAGQEQESAYPYTSGTTGDSGMCTANQAAEVMSLTEYFQISGSSASATEAAMATYVGTTGPLSICVDANNWSTYRGGIMSKCGQQIDHAVQVVGVNTDEGYWKVRNSWGTSWGESGYIRLAYGQNTCYITFEALYTTPKKL
jgi:C1A family cysteine protease